MLSLCMWCKKEKAGVRMTLIEQKNSFAVKYFIGENFFLLNLKFTKVKEFMIKFTNNYEHKEMFV